MSTSDADMRDPTAPARSARLPGFYRLDLPSRHALLAQRFGLSPQALRTLEPEHGLSWARADKMVENCIGVLGLPVGLGLNLKVNGVDYPVPMVVEEPSVVAAMSNVARMVYAHGGFQAESDPSVMIAQVQICALPDLEAAREALLARKAQIIDRANEVQPRMHKRGGGALDLEVRSFPPSAPGADDAMLVVHLLVDCVDAMGANAVNTMAEGVAPLIEEISRGQVYLRILSNLADRRLARARFSLPEHALDTEHTPGAEVAQGIVHAWRFADVDPYRAATHNKGIMNGIDAVALATGNDWRAIEAGAHAYAARDGRYRSLTRFWRAEGQLHGEIELPLAVGVVGGSTQVHPTIATLRALLGVDSAATLAGVMAAVGLAQNTAAIRALATEGIQRGHMALHARQIALAVGAPCAHIDGVAQGLVASGQINEGEARRILAALTQAG